MKEAPIAVVGMAFRFPGDLSDEQGLWLALKEGRDLVTQIDPGRWAVNELCHPDRKEPGRSITFSAGVLSRVEEFDSSFFGISPREASQMDPQQRLLLELAWEAMENGGQIPSRLAGSDIAVYVGISSMEYGMGMLGDLACMTGHSMTGNTLSIAANRLSYAFDFRGPSLAVDTACSSSLVALHHACNALRSGEASAALVGGVSLLLHPYPFIGFSKASMLSANGRCRAFDAAGDGYVRGEGGAVLLLKPLDRALADGDSIQGVILASGVNSDGERKTGMTIPSSEGQAELMQSVLQRSGLPPQAVDFIEAHGTGTPVGDPVEAAAIGRVYGACRPQGQPLPIGSVKTNMGHLEPASGMAGLVKALLSLKHRALPPSLHFEQPNPHIDFSGLNLEVATGLLPLEAPGGRALVAGVNSFGFGGTNAHVLLQEYVTAGQPPSGEAHPVPPLFLSARTPKALRETAARYAELLAQCAESDGYDIAHAALFKRQRLEKRLAVKTASARETAACLDLFAQGRNPAQVVLEDGLSQPGKVAFIYSGNGAQWAGMGRRLMSESATFSETMARLDAMIQPLAGFSILHELEAEGQNARLDDTAVAQPLLFAIQVALTFVLREQGVEPDAVAGHSVGEVAAAWAAGALDLSQAAEVICARSHAQAKTRGSGRMAAVGRGEAEMRELLAAGGYDDVEIAGFNSPENVTLSGSFDSLERLRSGLEPQGVFFRVLDIDYAFHSRSMDMVKDELPGALAHLAPRHGSDADFISTVTGDVLPGVSLAGEYWWHNVRKPVLFAQAVSALVARGCRIFVEIGPHAILQRYLGECLKATGAEGRVLDTLRRNDDGLARLEETVLRVHMLREPPQMDAYFPVPGGPVQLPNYPWQRECFGFAHTNEDYELTLKRRVHPLLGWRLKEADAAWENTLDPAILPWLADHKVGGAIVLPGAAYAEMALAAAREWFGGERFELEEMDILAPVVFEEGHARTLRLELSPRDGSFLIRSRQRLSDDEWTLNAMGRLPGVPGEALARDAEPFANSLEARAVIGADTHYRLTAAIGLDYGPAFRGLGEAHIRGHELIGTFTPPEGLDSSGYIIHPAMLDVCFQVLADFFREDIESGRGVPLLPVKFGRMRYLGKAEAVRFRARLLRLNARSAMAEFDLLDADGGVAAILSGCRFRAAVLQRQGTSAPACWDKAVRLVPHPLEQARIELPRNGELSRIASGMLVDEEAAQGRVAYFKEALPLFEALTVSFACEAFQQLLASKNDWLQCALTGAEQAQGDNRPRPFFRWLAALLREEGLLIEQDGVWRLEASGMPFSNEIWRTLLHDFPACLPELVLAARVGQNLPALLTGDGETAEEFLEEMENSPSCEILYDEAPVYLGIRLAVQHILHGLAVGLPANRRLRILEIGMGGGEIPRHLSLTCPDGQIDYVLAVSGESARDRLEAEFQNHPFVTIAGMAGDGLGLVAETALPEVFDVIIFRHWLHRVRHPVAALIAARRKLAMGGLLMLAERHADLGANLVQGVDPLWWHETEKGELASWLMPPAAWESALKEQDFGDVEIFSEPASEGLAEGSYLLLASRPHEAVAQPEPVVSNWLLLADESSRKMAGNLLQHLESRGQRAAVAFAYRTEEGALQAYEPHDPASMNALIRAARDRMEGIAHVVHLAGWEAPAAAGREFPESEAGVGLLHLVQALAAGDWELPRLWLLTAGGALANCPSASGRIDPLQSLLWGMGRVIANEYPALACTLIDIACDRDCPDLAQRLENELLHPDAESEIILAPDARYGSRMQRASPSRRLAADKDDAPRFRLDFHAPGQLRNLAWQPDPEHPLSDDEVEVHTMATGLNFRDVMYTMGMLPDEAVEKGFAGASLGLELSGVIMRTGKRVHEFVPGDQVIGFGSSCFASRVVTRANALAHKPAEWSFEEAATVPTVFFTVYYALKHLANLQPGERVLIHGAAGGVGIAAIQLASHMGAEIFATAGSGEKRDFVRLLGADHVFDSRNLDFAEGVLAATAGEGVDVVLNSLAGEAIRRNLRVLKPFGRFLELGKRDFFENTPIGLRPFKDNISYFGIDADQLLVARPDLAARLFREVMSLFREGVLAPLPYRAFQAGRVVDAFRAMQQSRHIGKLVVTLEGAQAEIGHREMRHANVRFEKNATYLVTGGISGFGLESARWLAGQGAGNLVLLGRRGMQTPGAADAIADFEALGASARVVACDVADRQALQSVIESIRREMPPLKGILHAAMSLDDALISRLDAARFREVLRPKLLGARHLHELTLDIPIEHFILYSSVTTYIGNPGQANYVAANAYLEGLANLRRSIGLPATCIGWGPISDAGYLTRNEAVKESLEARLGASALTSDRALAALGGILADNPGNVAVADFAWHALARLMPSSGSARFELLRREAGKAAGDDHEADFTSLIIGKSPEELQEIVQSLVVQEVAQILGVSPDRVNTARPLADMGMDSLMGVELALGLEERFGIRLPAMLLNEGPSAIRIAMRISERILKGRTEDEQEEGIKASVLAVVAQHGESVSDEQLSQVAADVEDHLKTGTGSLT
jgi:acyl transferase domain-containing protein/NADP-dependent 3-hydroxy acid dehydrogenase YdfG/acyl carrier protein